MILPIGIAGKNPRAPRATIALILINIFVYALTSPSADMDFVKFRMALFELVEVESEIESRYLGSPPVYLGFMGFEGGVGGEGPSRLRERLPHEVMFWETFRKGAIPESEEDVDTWLASLNAHDEARDSRLNYRYGVHQNSGPVSLVTSMFLHGGFWHLFGNMLFLWAVGVGLEMVWGPRLFLAAYFLTGIVSSLPELFKGSDIPTIGASGAVSGVMGAFLIRHATVKLRFVTLPFIPIMALPAWILLVYWFVLDVYRGLEGNTNVAHWSHVAGFLAGCVVALAYRVKGTEATALQELAESDTAKLVDKHLELAEFHRKRGDMRSFQAELQAAAKVAPKDAAVRRANLNVMGPSPARLREAESILEMLWLARERAEYLEVYNQYVGFLDGESPNPALTFRAAEALAPKEPHAAARLLWQLLADHPGHAIARRARVLYAELLEKLGDEAGARAVRAQLDGEL